MMKRSLCLLAMTAPLLLSAAPPPMRPVPHEQPANVENVNFLTRLLEGNNGNRRSSSHRRASRPPQGGAIPAPPALADVPVPQPKPMEAAQASQGDDDNSQAAAQESARPADTAGQPEKEKNPIGPPVAHSEPPRQVEAAQPQKPEIPKLEDQPKQTVQTPASNATEQQANPPAIAEVPVPLPKPDEKPSAEHPTAASNDAGPKPDGKEEQKAEAPPPPPPPPLVKEDPDELKACLAELTSLGAKFEPTDPIDDGNGCGIEHPIDVDQVLPGVSLGGAAMRCKTAVTMAHWLKDTVQPAMTIAMPGRKIVGLVPGSTYACRLRNSATTGKISEHARGNAYDVAAFKLDNGEKMEMKPRVEDSTLEGAFQRTATAGACLHFTTVLSPGSDAAHETHLHLDVLERKGGYRYCR